MSEVDEQAEKLKEQGNALFKSRNFQGAIEIYTLAIGLETAMIGVLYNNRSSAYYESGKYDLALEDIEQSFSYDDLDEKIREKLSNRKKKCLRFLSQKLPSIMQNFPMSRAMIGASTPFYAVGNETMRDQFESIDTTPDVALFSSAPAENDDFVYKLSNSKIEGNSRSVLLAVMGDPRHLLATCSYCSEQDTIVGNDYNPYLMTRNVLILDAIRKIKGKNKKSQAMYALSLWLSPYITAAHLSIIQESLRNIAQCCDWLDYSNTGIGKEEFVTICQQIAKEWLEITPESIADPNQNQLKATYFGVSPMDPTDYSVLPSMCGAKPGSLYDKTLKRFVYNAMNKVKNAGVDDPALMVDHSISFSDLIKNFSTGLSFYPASKSLSFNPTMLSKNRSDIQPLQYFDFLLSEEIEQSSPKFTAAQVQYTEFQSLLIEFLHDSFDSRLHISNEVIGIDRVLELLHHMGKALHRPKISLYCKDLFQLPEVVTRREFFDRIAVSNVSDYTTHLPIFAMLFPFLKEKGTVVSKWLTCSDLYPTCEEYVNQLNAQVDLFKLFGAKSLTASVFRYIVHEKNARVGELLVKDVSFSKEEFIASMVQMFRHTVLPRLGRSNPITSSLEFTPLNLECFYRVWGDFVRHETVYPAHWIEAGLEKISSLPFYSCFQIEDSLLRQRHGLEEKNNSELKPIWFSISHMIRLDGLKLDIPEMGAVVATVTALEKIKKDRRDLRTTLLQLSAPLTDIHVFSVITPVNGEFQLSIPSELYHNLRSGKLKLGSFVTLTFRVHDITNIRF